MEQVNDKSGFFFSQMGDDDFELPDDVVDAVVEEERPRLGHRDNQAGDARAPSPRPPAGGSLSSTPSVRRGGFLIGKGEDRAEAVATVKAASERILYNSSAL